MVENKLAKGLKINNKTFIIGQMRVICGTTVSLLIKTYDDELNI